MGSRVLNRPIRIVALTEPGRALSDKLHLALTATAHDCEQWFKPKPFTEQVQNAFSSGSALVLICATGIAVRTLAPVIRDKKSDPPVLVLDESGKFVIPILSGHEGGANQWAAEVAAMIQAQPVITSANAYLNPRYVAGMGCERNCPTEELQSLLENSVAQAGISLQQISSITSIDIKHDEAGLIELASKMGASYHTFSASELSRVEAQLTTRSEYVFNTVGVHGVAESAALTGARRLGDGLCELVLPKQKSRKATCAIARIYSTQS